MIVNKQTHRITPRLWTWKAVVHLKWICHGIYNNKLHCNSAETAEYGYDDIHSCCHYYGYGNFAPQLSTLAATMNALQNTFLHLRESVDDADDDKDYLYGTLVQATYQLWNRFAPNAQLWGVVGGAKSLKGTDTINLKALLRSEPVTPFSLHTFPSSYKETGILRGTPSPQYSYCRQQCWVVMKL